MTIDNEGIRKLVSLERWLQYTILQTINFSKVTLIIILKIYMEYLNNKKIKILFRISLYFYVKNKV